MNEKMSHTIYEEVVDVYLAARRGRTAKAYAGDLDAYARHQGQSRPEAIEGLLTCGPDRCRLALLRFVFELRRAGRAEKTIDRRVHTVLAVIRMAHDRGVIDWTPDLTDWSPEAVAMAAVEDRPGDEAYVLPRHSAEIDRLDLQHYALTEALGRHYLAEVPALRRVLDAGAGTGQWGTDLLQQHTDAFAVGLDLTRPKPGRPPGYHAVVGNLLHGLPFVEGAFDLVHQRWLISGIPLDAWPGLVRDLVRTCRPGGWVELVEGPTRGRREGPASERLQDLSNQLWGARGLDRQSVVAGSLDRYLVDAGLEDVQRHEVELPLGEWGGRLGQMMAADLRAVFQRMAGMFTGLGLSLDEFTGLVHAAAREWEELHTAYSAVVAWGRKPR
jgi:SAM-dependent methyltransferase